MSKAKSLLAGLVVLLALPILAVGQKASKVPTISSLYPNTKTTGAGSFALTVTGANFTSGSTVQWNGTGLTTTYVSSSQLQAAVDGTRIATAGTASVKAYTSGRYGGTSNTLSFTIAAPAATTTTITTTTTTTSTSTTPLSIATSSVPSGTAGTVYNTSLGASGGTPVYGWSLPSGGGALPPGLILATTGTLTGTPSTAGTYSFTVQAADSASTKQTAQKIFSMSVAAPPTTTTTTTTSSTGPLFKTGFETTEPAMDAMNIAPDTVITSTPPPGRSGNALQIHYYVCGASDGTCGGASQDKNRWASKVISPGQDHFFVRGFVYFGKPQNSAPITAQVQRKLVWLADSTSATSNVAGNYQLIMSSWMGTASGLPAASLVGQFNPGGACPATQWQVYSVTGGLSWDTWHELQFEMQLNTPGQLDGVARVWVNGVQTYANTAMNLRGICSTPISFFSVGEQANRYNYNLLDELRYWDDIAFSTSFIQ